ncbi:MAG: type I-E CRISPR-associated protein Cas5/CasD [Chloroflexi bacterium]|nr:type I-E CRISPR-associated protein Cas5/CasD [Chloroflexota bacterium]
MDTLLLCLSGPMQSWGVQSRFSIRETGLEPSKSGVIGLVCAAMGIPREDDESLSHLAELRMGIRVDREGILQVDYHTANEVLKASGGIKETEPSRRYYLAGAVFLAGLEGEERALLERIQNSLRAPVWPLCLGRKAFVPAESIWLQDGLRLDHCLEKALADYPLLARPVSQDGCLRLVCEDATGTAVRSDQPLSFISRRFAPRRVATRFIPLPDRVKEAV